MPRYKKELASKPLTKASKLKTPEEVESGYEYRVKKGTESTVVKSSGLSGQRAFQADNPDRFTEPALNRSEKAYGKASQAKVSQQFSDYVSGNDIRKSHEAESDNFLPLDWKPGLEQGIKQVSKKRKDETVNQAKLFGSGPSWEDIHPERQQHILNKLASHGITPENASTAFGSQVRSAIRSGLKNDSDPYASSFYHLTGHRGGAVPTPRQQVQDTANHFGVPFHVAVVAHAMTSPQLPFEYRSGESTFAHNDDAARQALHFAIHGTDVSKLQAGDLSHLHPNARPIRDMHKTVGVLRQMLSGTPINKVKGPTGKEPFGDKTGAYAHAWLDPNSKNARQVIDTHTVMGFAPHLDKQKDEHSTVLKIDGAHAFFDYIGKKVMAEHGLNNIHYAQAAQWGQQRIDASQISDANAYAKYAPNHKISRAPMSTTPGDLNQREQGTLF